MKIVRREFTVREGPAACWNALRFGRRLALEDVMEGDTLVLCSDLRAAGVASLR